MHWSIECILQTFSLLGKNVTPEKSPNRIVVAEKRFMVHGISNLDTKLSTQAFQIKPLFYVLHLPAAPCNGTDNF